MSTDPSETEPVFDGVMRIDTVTGQATTRSFGPGQRTHEFVFAASGPDAAEDDGVLMGFVSDLAEQTSRLVVLDAATLEDVAAVHIPARIPFGFHGTWVPTGL